MSVETAVSRRVASQVVPPSKDCPRKRFIRYPLVRLIRLSYNATLKTCPSGEAAMAGLNTAEPAGLSLIAFGVVQVAPPSEDLVKRMRGWFWKSPWKVTNRWPTVRSVAAEGRKTPSRAFGAS